MSIGIALATYNGAAFIRDQLESIAGQTRSPAHVVISDDGSSDDTVAIAAEFQRRVPWRVDILRATTPSGPMGNFLKAARACDAEFIAFCDQDDLWLPSKLEQSERRLRASEALVLVHSIVHVERDGRTRADAQRIDVPSRDADGLDLQPHAVFPGMCMVIRKGLLEAGEPLRAAWNTHFDALVQARPAILSDHWTHAHDMYALTIARLLGRIALVREPLAHQRLHESNYSRRSPAAAPPTTESSPNAASHSGHDLLASFCAEFAEVLRSVSWDALPEGRRRAAVAHYVRWADIWTQRAALHARDAGLMRRADSFLTLLGRGSYRPALRGGLGVRSLAKDALAIVGVRAGIPPSPAPMA
jgi:glycosyltransferase involved in cell wall biosynthesis